MSHDLLFMIYISYICWII